MSDWDHRMMFDRYLYDYMRKKNMHQTADIFRREANVVLHPSFPPGIDVPDGFLHEWWLVFYDMYRSQQLRGHAPGEGPNMMIGQLMGARRQTDPHPLGQHEMNQQAISRVITDADSSFNSGVSAMGSRRSPLIGPELVPRGISSSSHQFNSLTSKSVPYPPGNPANLPVQEVGCSLIAASRKDKDIMTEEENELIIPPPGFESYVLNSLWVTEKHQQELKDKSLVAQMSGGKSVNTTDSIDGNSNGSSDMDTSSDASLTKFKSNDDNVKSSSPNAEGNKDNADSSSNKSPEFATADDDLKGGISSEPFISIAILTIPNMRYIPYMLMSGTS
ncbi:hypothetical protein AB3S75_039104 [Citrus x aurantiifolia]